MQTRYIFSSLISTFSFFGDGEHSPEFIIEMEKAYDVMMDAMKKEYKKQHPNRSLPMQMKTCCAKCGTYSHLQFFGGYICNNCKQKEEDKDFEKGEVKITFYLVENKVIKKNLGSYKGSRPASFSQYYAMLAGKYFSSSFWQYDYNYYLLGYFVQDRIDQKLGRIIVGLPGNETYKIGSSI